MTDENPWLGIDAYGLESSGGEEVGFPWVEVTRWNRNDRLYQRVKLDEDGYVDASASEVERIGPPAGVTSFQDSDMNTVAVFAVYADPDTLAWGTVQLTESEAL